MKHVFQILVNLFILFMYFLQSTFHLIWFGELLKVSPYHGTNNKFRTPQNIKDWRDVYFQGDVCISKEKEKQLAQQTIKKIIDHPMYREYLATWMHQSMKRVKNMAHNQLPQY